MHCIVYAPKHYYFNDGCHLHFSQSTTGVCFVTDCSVTSPLRYLVLSVVHLKNGAFLSNSNSSFLHFCATVIGVTAQNVSGTRAPCP